MYPRHVSLPDDPLWHKDAVIYQVHVKAFMDSDKNGIGDFQGLLSKLDYLQDLGVTTIWLLPFYPSPLKDDGYDTADYFGVHADYGTVRDFEEFLKSAHYRGMRIITELVLNHTSDQHRWFKLARTSRPDSEMRGYYVWSQNPDKYREARVIFHDFEASNWTWDPVARAYYWHRFYSHQPDLNLDNPEVKKSLIKVLDFWLGLGVDGLRLDAIPYLFEREGTNCENLPETHEFIKELRAHVDAHFKNRVLLAEANQWPEDAAAYFGDNDECHMAFHFPIMPRLFMALRMEDRFPVIDILEQTPEIPEDCQWSIFLRNHDELTLEMVTDEERDYMYQVYAKDPRARLNMGIRRRLAPLLNNNRRKLELLYVLLFSLPGTPIIYYGDEIGMGDNYFLGDRNGVRTPMQWSPDRNAGFSKANPQHLYLPVILDPEYHFEVVNVENQEKNLSSLLWWMRRTIAMRKNYKAFGRGSIEFLLPENPKVMVFLRKYQNETLLIVINLSDSAQVAAIDLSPYAGYFPVELFSGNSFPIIKETPYVFTLGNNGYFWFSLYKEEELSQTVDSEPLPVLEAVASWEEVFGFPNRNRLEMRVLPAYIKKQRWFRSKGKSLSFLRIRDDFPLSDGQALHHLFIVETHFNQGGPEFYFLPVSFCRQQDLTRLEEQSSQGIIAYIEVAGEKGGLVDSIYERSFRNQLLEIIAKEKVVYQGNGRLFGLAGEILKAEAGSDLSAMESQVLKAEQSNTSILYDNDNKFLLKLYRKLEQGINPDPEVVLYLTEKRNFPYASPFSGQLAYRRSGEETMTLGLFQRFVPNQGDAWSFVLDNLQHFFEYILAGKTEIKEIPQPPSSLLQNRFASVDELFLDGIGGYFLEMIILLGQISGEMHLALSREQEDKAFVPEPFSKLYQRSMYQSMRSLTRKTIASLQRNLHKLSESVQAEAKDLIRAEADILHSLEAITTKKIEGSKIRIHGDYHLGQVLYTGNSFVIIDFEGEPARPLSERRLKRSCLKDAAGMVRSFHYAAYFALYQKSSVRSADLGYLKEWLEPWYRVVAGVFLESYLEKIQGSGLIPEDKSEQEMLLNVYLLEKAVYELGYELDNRPEWMGIAIRGIRQIIGQEKRVRSEEERG
ncbi:MAG: maltose alpha-D-glucosyltransferase [Desulfohalobiaceae bacterium]|nr:maltose alpha-D-glucosyltransferase [Desulfohalobiaceae bacterium]